MKVEVRDFEEFRARARALLQNKLSPEKVQWVAPFQETDLFSASRSIESPPLLASAPASDSTLYVPRDYASLARNVAHHASAKKWELLYRILWRLKHETPALLEITTDDDVYEAMAMQKAVTREIHKMHAFVRFERIGEPPDEHYTAWHGPEHPVLPLAAPFFARRFGDKPWSIHTPHGSVHWDGEKLHDGPAVETQPKRAEEFDALWKSYYRSTFNPARIKLKAMTKEMPKRYWGSLPEAEIIQDLIRDVPTRLAKMAANQNKQATPPEGASFPTLRSAALGCQACPLAGMGTQTVFGEGPLNASIMIVGEQPGDTEDLEGRPFVGPAGQVLAKALASARLDRESLYLTNSVKHFKWKPGPPGKPRLHQKPSGSEMHACRPWLEKEIELIRPDVIVCLGQTAATTLFGRMVKISDERSRIHRDFHWAPNIIVSYHPSAILRAYDETESTRMLEALKADLALASALSNDALNKN